MEKMYKAEFYSKKIKEVDVVNKTATMVEFRDVDGFLLKERKNTSHHCYTGTREEARDAILRRLRDEVRKAESALTFLQQELDAFLFANLKNE
jgi:hypothetical protein